jgi:hypothetical protein
MSDLFIGPNRLIVDMEDRNGDRIGPGPLVTVMSLDYGYRLSESGDFNAVLALSDPRASLVIPKGVVLAFWFDEEFLFRGIVEHTIKSVDSGGVLRLQVRGRDLTGELAEAPVGDLNLTNGSGAGVTDGPAQILSVANIFNDTTWDLDTTDGYATTSASIYGQYSGESALAALIMAAQKSGEHWRVATDGTREIVWLRTDTDNNYLRAIPTAGEPVQAEDNPNVCFIQGFSEEVDAYRMITRVYPWGAGDGELRLSLKASDRVAPSGFTLSTANNYIESDNAVTAIGKSIGLHVRFQDIRPISNTSADIESAANQLYDAALAYLKRHDFASDLKTYKLNVIKLPRRVAVGHIVTVEYQDQGYVVDGEEMVIIAIRNRIDSSGARSSDLTVSGVARWMEDASREIVSGMEQGKLFTSHPQRGPNSYVTNYQRYVWHDGVNSEVAKIRFRFGPEVAQLNQVCFDFETDDGTRMLQLESTVRSVGGTSTTTGGGGATVTATGGGSSHSHTVTIADHQHSVTLPDHDHDIPDHQHRITVAGSGGSDDLLLNEAGGVGFLAKAGAGDIYINTNPDSGGTTSDDGGADTITSGDGGATAPTSSADTTHTHSLTLIDHTHTVTPNISAVYGVYRESNSLTFNIADLEYQVNGDGWTAVSTDAESLGSNWYRLDMTEVLYDSNFVPLQSSNLLEFRRKTAGSFASRVSCMIDGQLLVRTIIQSIALT